MGAARAQKGRLSLPASCFLNFVGLNNLFSIFEFYEPGEQEEVTQ